MEYESYFNGVQKEEKVEEVLPSDAKNESEIIEVRQYKLASRLAKEKAAFASKSNQVLKFLDLSGNAIAAKFISQNKVILGDLARLSSLQELDLSYN